MQSESKICRTRLGRVVESGRRSVVTFLGSMAEDHHVVRDHVSCIYRNKTLANLDSSRDLTTLTRQEDDVEHGSDGECGFILPRPFFVSPVEFTWLMVQ